MELVSVEQRERQQLAAVLHDNLQQLLVAARYHVGALAGSLDDERLVTAARAAEGVLDKAIGECRSLTIELRPPILREGGLARALHGEFPDMLVIGLSMYTEDHRANEMHAAGAVAYISKEEPSDVVIATILECCRAADTR